KLSLERLNACIQRGIDESYGVFVFCLRLLRETFICTKPVCETAIEKLAGNRRFESPRVLRRLHSLRKWSHYEQAEQVFPGSARTRRSSGAGAPWRVSVAVGGRRVYCAEDRLRSSHAAGVGQAQRDRQWHA